MPRNSGGRFQRFLEFIGVVEEIPAEEDIQGNGYVQEDDYGRRQTYQPRSNKNTTIPKNSSGRRVDARVPSYTGSTPRARSTSVREAEYATDYGATRANPAGSRTNSASSRTARTNRYADEPKETRELEPVRAPQPARPQRMVMLSMQRLEDCCDVIDHLIAGNMVIITLDDMDVKINQRVVDTLSGSVYALKAKIRKASEKTYLVAPGNIDIDDQEYLTRNY